MKLPNLIHAGVPKSASATINAMLADHPDVFLPRQKEPNFFNADDRFAEGIEWYSSAFFADAGEARIVGDMSIGYATGFGFDTPERIAQSLGPDLKILLTFREPAARAYSQYGMARDKGQIERLKFADAVDGALRFGPTVTDDDRRRARTGTYYSRSKDMEVFRWCMYIEPGYYADIVQRWSDVFGPDNVLVLITEDISRDLQAEADRLFAFLGVSSIPVSAGLRRNSATQLRVPALRRTLNRLYAIGPVRRILNAPQADWIRDKTRRLLLSRNYVETGTREAPDPAVMARLRAHYLPQVERLEAMLGRRLDMWRTSSRPDEAPT